MKTSLVQSLLVTFAKEIVDDQDLIETIAFEHEQALKKIRAERRRSKRRRSSINSMTDLQYLSVNLNKCSESSSSSQY